MNIFPVLRIAGPGNFYDTRRCNKAYPVSFGDRLSFSQESGLDVQICCIEVCRQISAFSRERHLPCQYRESVSKVRLHQSLSLPRLLFNPKCHDRNQLFMLSHKFTPVMQNLLEETKCSFDRPPAVYCFVLLIFLRAGLQLLWAVPDLGDYIRPLFSSFLHGRPVFPVPGDGTGCEQNLWQPHLNRIYTY